MISAKSGLERLLVGEPDRDRINVEDVVHVGADRLLQLVVNTVPGAVADQCAEPQSHLASLPKEQADVRVVAGVEDDIRALALELDHQRRQVGCRRRISLVDHDVEAGLPGALLGTPRHVDTVRPIFMDDGDAQVLRRLAELLLRVCRDEAGRCQAELAAARLRSEDIFQVTVLEDGRRDTSGDPHELLDLIHPRRDGNALRRGEEAEEDVDLLLLDQAHGFVDGDLGLALRVRIDWLDLITLDPAVPVEIVDHDLGAERVEIGATARQRAAVVVDHPDPDLLLRFLRRGYCRSDQQRRGDRRARKAGASIEEHRSLPDELSLLSLLWVTRSLQARRRSPSSASAGSAENPEAGTPQAYEGTVIHRMAKPPERLVRLVLESHDGTALVPIPERSTSP